MQDNQEIKTLEGVFIGTDFNGTFITKDGIITKLAKIPENKIDDKKVKTLNLDVESVKGETINVPYINLGEINRAKTNFELGEEICQIRNDLSSIFAAIADIQARLN